MRALMLLLLVGKGQTTDLCANCLSKLLRSGWGSEQFKATGLMDFGKFCEKSVEIENYEHDRDFGFLLENDGCIPLAVVINMTTSNGMHPLFPEVN